ncbi:MAG: amino acid ABC transporter ATP-binding protein [Pseudomonadota bacterium]
MTRPLIEAHGVGKKFGSNEVLRDVSLTVAPGETVVIIGPSGSGKSTLLRCINLLEDLDSGSIVFEGREIRTGRGAHRIRRELGMVFQNFELFAHLSAADNVMLAPRRVLGMGAEEARALAHEMLTKVHIPEKADAHPDELSGGQQQRVAIARALAMRPKAMLYDEPTSALDPEMIKEVLDVIRELSQDGMTSIVVTHEMGFARSVADRIVFMDEGEVISDAPTDTFFAGSAHPRAAQFLQQILPH